jgi:TRAP-type mannitol/chloroaromatic compound transport system permease large subunit
VAPPAITISHMYRGVVPFIVLQLATLAVTMAFPQLVTWLPSKMLQFR